MGNDDADCDSGDGDGASTLALVQWHVANDMPSEHSNVFSVAIIIDDNVAVDDLRRMEMLRMRLPLEVLDRRAMIGVNLMVGFRLWIGLACACGGEGKYLAGDIKTRLRSCSRHFRPCSSPRGHRHTLLFTTTSLLRLVESISLIFLHVATSTSPSAIDDAIPLYDITYDVLLAIKTNDSAYSYSSSH